MIIPSVIIPTYVLFATYLIGVIIYLKRFILRPPTETTAEENVVTDDTAEIDDQCDYNFEFDVDFSFTSSGAISQASMFSCI